MSSTRRTFSTDRGRREAELVACYVWFMSYVPGHFSCSPSIRSAGWRLSSVRRGAPRCTNSGLMGGGHPWNGGRDLSTETFSHRHHTPARNRAWRPPGSRSGVSSQPMRCRSSGPWIVYLPSLAGSPGLKSAGSCLPIARSRHRKHSCALSPGLAQSLSVTMYRSLSGLPQPGASQVQLEVVPLVAVDRAVGPFELPPPVCAVDYCERSLCGRSIRSRSSPSRSRRRRVCPDCRIRR